MNPKQVMRFINAKWGMSLSLISDLLSAKYIAAGTFAKMRDKSTNESPERWPDLKALGSRIIISVPMIAIIAPYNSSLCISLCR